MAAAGKKAAPSGMKELREDIRKKEFRRVYLFYGEESYLVLQYRQNLIRAVLGEDDAMNLNIHRDDRFDWDAVQDEILSMPFFAGHRMVVLDDTRLFRSGRKAEDEEEDENEENGDNALSAAIAAFLPQIPESTVVLFTERPDEKKAGGQKGKVSVDRRGKLFRAVAKYGLPVEFSSPDETELRKWVLGKLGPEKIQITSGALDTFFLMTGSDMSHISAEIEKLIAYAGEGGVIRTKDVLALTSEILEGKIFRMIDLIAQRDQKGALDLYNDLLVLKEPPGKIFSLLTRQFDQLLLTASILREGGSAGRVMEELGLKKWQAEKLIRQSRTFRISSIRETLERCARMEEKAKSGHIDMQLGLELLILQCSGRTG